MKRGVLGVGVLVAPQAGGAQRVEGLRGRFWPNFAYVYIVKHDPFGPAKVVVGVSIALHALLLALSRDIPSKTKSRPPRGPRSASHT